MRGRERTGVLHLVEFLARGRKRVRFPKVEMALWKVAFTWVPSRRDWRGFRPTLLGAVSSCPFVSWP